MSVRWFMFGKETDFSTKMSGIISGYNCTRMVILIIVKVYKLFKNFKKNLSNNE